MQPYFRYAMIQETNEGIDIQPLHHTPGLIVEKLNPLAPTTTSWQLIQRIDLKPFFLRRNQLISSWEVLTAHCAQLSGFYAHKLQIKQSLSQLEDTIRAGDHMIDMRISHEVHKSNRERRAWFSVVGKMNNFLFGPLDKVSEEELERLIDGTNNETTS